MNSNEAIDVEASSPTKRPKLDPHHESDTEVELLSPSKFKQAVPNNDNNAANIENNEGDEIQVTSSNTINPNIDYPHIRPLCGVHAFSLTAKNADNTDNANHCEKCYCYICDCTANECEYWTHPMIESKAADANNGNDDTVKKLCELGPHCHAHSDKSTKGTWDGLRDYMKKKKSPPEEQPVVADNGAAVLPVNPYAGMSSAAIRDEVLNRLANMPDNTNTMVAERIRAKKDMRIPEILLENFRNSVTLHENTNNNNTTSQDSKPIVKKKTVGDIPTLALSPTFIEGIQIGFPFPKIMKPQRQIMLHLIRALKNSKHVVLESPTGTGKSAAILCGVLAWQRWYWKRLEGQRSGVQEKKAGDGEGANSNAGDGRVKIIYCSRTHSQVTQMVASLKSTPYRPRMAILGSRDRLCIHKSIKPRTPGAESITGINVNNECRMRVRNTEKYRKQKLTNPSSDDPYLDEDPPDDMPGDGNMDAMQDGPREGEDEDNNFVSRSKTCPHYRQLTANRVANLAQSTFVPNSKTDCCTVGGKKSKYGAHDIEDLVEFGKDPYLQKGVALYRGQDSESYGLRLKGPRKGSNNSGCHIQSTVEGSPADMVGSLENGDTILRVNGCDITRENVDAVAKKIMETSDESLILDVSRGGSGSLSRNDGEYSSHSACPYYISHALAKDADLVFAPYNYVLDPKIRDAMGIQLNGSIVILDEGHNIESTLREAGSGRFGEFELCDLLVMLNNYSITEKNTYNMLEVEGEGETVYLCDVAHILLMFVEKLVVKLKESRLTFERNPGSKGAQGVLRDYEKFHTSDDTQFEISLDGPTGNGVRGAAVGCLPFFEKLGIQLTDLELLVRHVTAFEKFLRGQESNESNTERDRISNLLDRLVDLVHKMCSARTKSEHYYSAISATANGNLDFANGVDAENNEGTSRRWKKKPRALPLVAPRTAQHPDRPPNPCLHAVCKARSPNVFDPIRHGHSCDGSTPKWEAVLSLELLTPGPLFQELADECRTVVLASGSLAPIPSLCAELNLFPADAQIALKNPSTPTQASRVQKRLQSQPRPLEADHVVNLEKQLFVTSIGHFADGSELQVSHRNYSKMEFLEKLGDSVVKVVEGIPHGGVLVFLPSYSLLRKCERLWNSAGSQSSRNRSFWATQFEGSGGPSVWDRLKALKHNVIMEPSGSNQTEFEEKKQEYMDSVDQQGGCVLFAVYRGKMSEGISFNDNYARAVICIGVPLPNTFALPIKIKMNYNDEQRKLRQRTDLLPGREWYSQQAYRAIAQALGRCIRHSADYGAIILMDSRHCDEGIPNDGIPNSHKNLPKWMRSAVRNLSMNSTPRNSMFTYATSKSVHGGYGGLKRELHKFFRDAKPFVASVVKSQTAPSRSTSQTPQLTPLPGSSMAPLSISSGSSSSVIKSVGHIQLSTASKPNTSNDDDVKLLDSQSTQHDGVKIVSKQNTLMTAFQKQRDNEPAKAPKVAKRSTTPTNLKTMFEKQQQEKLPNRESQPQNATNAEQNLHPNTHEPMEIDPQVAAISSNQNMTQDMGTNTSELQATLHPVAFSFKKSPFAEYVYSPQETALPVAQPQIAIASASLPHQQDTTQKSNDEDENLCVICEDGKKQVVLLPCKHMCLCKACADFDKIKECPLCRTKVESSMTVFI